MPIRVLFAKITPSHIEATCYAFLTGTMNFTFVFLGPVLGSLINDTYVGVTEKNLDNFYILAAIPMLTSLIPLLYRNLIPLNEEVQIMG